MNTRFFNLALMVIWLAVFAGLMTRDWWMPANLLDRVNGPNTAMVTAMTLVMAMWNLARHITTGRLRTRGPSRGAEERRQRIRARLGRGDQPAVTDPEFRFDSPPADKPS